MLAFSFARLGWRGEKRRIGTNQRNIGAKETPCVGEFRILIARRADDHSLDGKL
jgi:hypothetical protein